MNHIIISRNGPNPIILRPGGGLRLYHEPTIAAGPLAHITFDDGNGNDSSGNGNHFSAVGSPSISSGIFTTVNAGGAVSDYFDLADPAPARITGEDAGQEYVRVIAYVRVPSGAGLIEAYPVGCRTDFLATWGMRVIDNGSETGCIADFYFSLDGVNFTSNMSEEFPYDTWTEIEAYLILADPDNSNNVTDKIRINGGSWSTNTSGIAWVPTTSPGCQIGAANEQSYGSIEVDWVQIWDTAPA